MVPPAAATTAAASAGMPPPANETRYDWLAVSDAVMDVAGSSGVSSPHPACASAIRNAAAASTNGRVVIGMWDMRPPRPASGRIDSRIRPHRWNCCSRGERHDAGVGGDEDAALGGDGGAPGTLRNPKCAKVGDGPSIATLTFYAELIHDSRAHRRSGRRSADDAVCGGRFFGLPEIIRTSGAVAPGFLPPFLLRRRYRRGPDASYLSPSARRPHVVPDRSAAQALVVQHRARRSA